MLAVLGAASGPFIEGLAKEEAKALLATCHAGRCAMKLHLGPLAFALSRPSYRSDDPGLSMKSWTCVWRDCSLSVNRAGLNPGVWAKACSGCREGEEAHATQDASAARQGRQIRLHGDDPILHSLVSSAVRDQSDSTMNGPITVVPEGALYAAQETPKIVAVLMCSVWERITDPARLNFHEFRLDALVVLSDLRFAYIVSCHRRVFDDPGKGCASIDVQSSCDDVLASARGSWMQRDGRLCAKLPLGGRLFTGNFASAEIFHRVPRTVERGLDEGENQHTGIAALLVRCFSEHMQQSSHSGDGFAIGQPAEVQRPVVASPAADVIDEGIQHFEPPAVVDAEAAALQTRHDWADNVQQLVNNSTPPASQDEHGEEYGEAIFRLSYSRTPSEFREALLDGVDLQHVRCSMASQGCAYDLPGSGAKIFVEPYQYDLVMEAVRSQGIGLRASDVIVAESFLPQLEAAIASIPSRRNVRVRQDHVLTRVVQAQGISAGLPSSVGLARDTTDTAGTSDDSSEPINVERTFLCNISIREPRRLMNPRSVAQSTTEAHGGVNPRRLAVRSDFGSST